MPKSHRWFFKDTRIPPSDLMYNLIKFYVWKCPVPGVSAKTKTLAEYGWTGRSINTLRKEIRNHSTLTRNTFKTLDRIDDLIPKFEELRVDDSYDLSKEFAICYAGGKTHTDAFFYMIRNAIAHGSFCIRTKKGVDFVILETSRGGNLRGRAILKVETLSKIRTIVEHPKKYGIA